MTFTVDMTLTMKKETFLSNRQNKQRFIFMLSEELQKKNCETHQASGDADLLIVQKAVQPANITNTVLVGDDTDPLILLCYHASLESHDLFFCPEPKKNTKEPHIWNIKPTKKMLGTDICKHILFLHAVLGIEKGASLKKFKALVIIYNGKSIDALDTLRYQQYWNKAVSSSSHVQPQTLPPTSEAAKYHSLCMYLQVQQWKSCAAELLLTDWGWQKSGEGFVPIQTSLAPAPEKMLCVIRCNCQSDCHTMRCICKKHNIECTPACGNCRGSGPLAAQTLHVTMMRNMMTLSSSNFNKLDFSQTVQ